MVVVGTENFPHNGVPDLLNPPNRVRLYIKNGDKMLILGGFNFHLWDFNDENWKPGGLDAALVHQIHH